MDSIDQEVTPLSPDEAAAIAGGSSIQVAAFLASCFAAGFDFGYSALGPRLFG